MSWLMAHILKKINVFANLAMEGLEKKFQDQVQMWYKNHSLKKSGQAAGGKFGTIKNKTRGLQPLL